MPHLTRRRSCASHYRVPTTACSDLYIALTVRHRFTRTVRGLKIHLSLIYRLTVEDIARDSPTPAHVHSSVLRTVERLDMSTTMSFRRTARRHLRAHSTHQYAQEHPLTSKQSKHDPVAYKSRIERVLRRSRSLNNVRSLDSDNPAVVARATRLSNLYGVSLGSELARKGAAVQRSSRRKRQRQRGHSAAHYISGSSAAPPGSANDHDR